MTSHLYAGFSFVAVILCAIPFYWHLQGSSVTYLGSWLGSKRFFFVAWNTGTCLYMAWVGLGCLVQCVNAILWNNNMVIKATVWCDIGEFQMLCLLILR